MTGRLLQVIDSLRIGGAETLLLDLLDAAAARGWRSEVAYFTPGPLAAEVAARGVPSTRLSEAGLKDPRALTRAAALMRRFKPDVVHTHLTKSCIVGQIAAGIARTPCRVLSVHNVDPWRRNRLASFAWRLATAGAHARIAVSQRVADHVVACGGAAPGGMTVIDNGVDMDRFDRRVVTPFDRAALGLAPEHVAIAIVGRLTAQKDHATFLSAAARLAARAPAARFVIVGDGELRAELEAQAATLGLGPDRLRFTGALRDVPALLAAVDVIAFSSAWEGLPMALIEAMAMELPVAATAVGGIPDVLRDGMEGLLVPPRDPEALAVALGALVADPALRARLGSAGRATVAARFGAAAMQDRLFALYAPRSSKGGPEWTPSPF